MRRRLPQKEIAFSFDSFLDLVANVVGIILRLILVAWVGARTYKAILPPPPPPPPALADPAPLPDPTDPREPLLAQRRGEIERGKSEALQHDRQVSSAAVLARRLQDDLAALRARRAALTSEQGRARGEAGERSASARQAGVGVEELRARSAKLAAELEELKRLPPARKELRYQTPV